MEVTLFLWLRILTEFWKNEVFRSPWESHCECARWRQKTSFWRRRAVWRLRSALNQIECQSSFGRGTVNSITTIPDSMFLISISILQWLDFRHLRILNFDAEIALVKACIGEEKEEQTRLWEHSCDNPYTPTNDYQSEKFYEKLKRSYKQREVKEHGRKRSELSVGWKYY